MNLQLKVFHWNFQDIQITVIAYGIREALKIGRENLPAQYRSILEHTPYKLLTVGSLIFTRGPYTFKQTTIGGVIYEEVDKPLSDVIILSDSKRAIQLENFLTLIGDIEYNIEKGKLSKVDVEDFREYREKFEEQSNAILLTETDIKTLYDYALSIPFEDTDEDIVPL